jgi:hypothetical protein
MANTSQLSHAADNSTEVHLVLNLQAQQEVAQVHSEVGGFHDTKTSDADGRVRRKEKKKKPEVT